MPASSRSRPPVACAWLHDIAAGYLLGPWKISTRRSGALWGYAFERKQGRASVGMLVGFVTGKAGVLSWAQPAPPECLVCAFVPRAPSGLHQRLVKQEGSLFRRCFELMTKYTVRRPRYEFHEEQGFAIARHVPLAQFPAREREKYARNFFIESLTILVRARLPESLLGVRLSGA